MAENIFINDTVNQQLAAEDDMVGTQISRVLIIYTGGTIGMKNTPDHGYRPVPGYLSQTLSSMTRFHDPTGFATEAVQRMDDVYALHQENHAAFFPLTNTVNVPTEYPTVTADQPVGVEMSPNSTNNSDPREPTISPTSTIESPEASRRHSGTQYTINGTPVVRSKKAALITPPSLFSKRIRYSILEYDPLLDSSNMTMKDWVKIATDIEVNYKLFDAFIILHGTDTMAYTASALSFMLENLGKTVIITGSQVPLAEVRNDAVDNLLGALTIAAHFVIPEVGLYFDNKLFRGNRASKVNAVEFNAFDSPNLRPLVKVGVNIDVSWSDVWRPTEIAKFRAHKVTNPAVATLRLFPGITESTVRAFLSVPIAGVVLETYGSGNAPNNRPELLQILKEASERGVVIVNCTQCKRGLVTDLYATGRALTEVGVVPGSDMTPECALTKLSYLLGKFRNPVQIRALLRKSLRGELTQVVRKQRFTYLQSPSLVSSILAILGKEVPDRGVDDINENESSGLEKTLVPMVLCQAARTGDVNALQSMAKVYPHLVNAVDYDGRTPLHIAASEGQIHAVKALLRLGAHVHARDRFGQTALRNAIKFGFSSTVRILCTAGAHITELEAGDVTNEIVMLVGMGDLARIKMFVEAGADLNLPWIDSRTPLHMAARENQIDLVKYFVELALRTIPAQTSNDQEITQDPEESAIPILPIDLEPVDKYGRTPLDDAMQNGSAGRVVVNLLREGIEKIILSGFKLRVL